MPKRGVLSLTVVALTVVAIGIAVRVRSERRLAAWTARHAVPTVAVVHPAQAAASTQLTLPASLQALNSTPIYARTTGYVQRWLVDIGDTVLRGQLLAVLEAPELEQQLAEARADLETALANQELASSTAARWGSMLTQDAVSKQAADEKAGDLAAKQAVVNAARANVARLSSLAGFTRLTAPFDGVVTTRSAQLGTLVSAGSASPMPLFTIADTSRIRAYVRVPQVYSTGLSAGMEVRLSLPEYPGRGFVATLTRTSGAIDPSSGTLLVELQAANAEGALKPGAYAQATFSLAGGGKVVTLPPSALLFGERGSRVAVIGPGEAVEMRTVTLGRDLGTAVEVTAGLAASDVVIDNPPESLETGDRVRVAPAEAQKSDAPK